MLLIPLGIVLLLDRTTRVGTTLSEHYSGSRVHRLGKASVLDGESGARRDPRAVKSSKISPVISTSSLKTETPRMPKASQLEAYPLAHPT